MFVHPEIAARSQFLLMSPFQGKGKDQRRPDVNMMCIHDKTFSIDNSHHTYYKKYSITTETTLKNVSV